MTNISVTTIPKAKFWPGHLYFTPAAEQELVREDIESAIKRHYTGDWGDLCAEDKDANEQALRRAAVFRVSRPQRREVLGYHRERQKRDHRAFAGRLLA